MCNFEEEIRWIEEYIIYLITQCGLSVTIHPIEKESLISLSRLQRFNIHDNSYCTCIKTQEGGHQRCLLQQKKVFERMLRTKAPFCGVCYSGVFEYVYPLISNRRIIGFVSAGAFACEAGKPRVRKIAAQYGDSLARFERTYGSLRQGPVDQREIDTLMMPLCRMLELAYLKHGGEKPKERRIDEILAYIKSHDTTDLTVAEICERFGCSRSYFSHAFKGETGMSFKQYLLKIRMENAKRLLQYSDLNVTEIAFSVGFHDPNYFSNVFKKEAGESPLSYRKNAKR